MSEYDQDFYLWAQQQAQLLRERRFDEIDLPNMVEEVESIARAEVRAIKESVTEIIVSTLLLRAAPTAKERWKWKSSITHHQIKIDVTLEASPSLRSMLRSIVNKKRAVAEKLAAAHLAALDYPGADSLDGMKISLEDVFGLYMDAVIK